MTAQTPDSLAQHEGARTAHENRESWVGYAGLIRCVILLIAIVGTLTFDDPPAAYVVLLLAAYYTMAAAASVWHLMAFLRGVHLGLRVTWVQVLIDFSSVALTVHFTGGPGSFFTFLFVVVILETALLVGIRQGFVFALFATAFMLAQAGWGAYSGQEPNLLHLWYNFVVQGLAYFLTAAISGFWNHRIRLMQHFQSEILDNMNSGFVVTDEKGLVTAHNRAAERILEIDRLEGIGRPVQEILRLESGAESPVLTAIRSERDFNSYEFHAILRSGKLKLLGLTTSRIHDPRERLKGVIASFTDLTDSAMMREELQRQDRLAYIGELSAGLAHEIRNPVAAIRGAMDELSQVPTENHMAQRLTAIAIRESDHLNQIVQGFLDFARNPTIERQRVDVVALVESLVETLRRKFNGGGITIATTLPEGPCTISGDPSQLKQVFMNLATNGIEAMPTKGTLEIAIVAEAGSVEVRFLDEGPGIEPDKVARIFEPFYTTKPSGVGMGLSVVQRIITAHDGTIRITSREGGGASVIVRLPIAKTEA